MTDFLFQMGVSNACFSLALAIVAMLVGARARRPHLAHMLWLLVFVKLVTPPLVSIPVIAIPGQPEAAVVRNDHSHSALPVAGGRQFDASAGMPVGHNREFDADGRPEDSLSARIGSVAFSHGRRWLPPVWLLGSVMVFSWSLVRVYRFGRLLKAESEAAPQQLRAAAVKIARRLKLKTIPTICTTSARLSPMVWWTGGEVRVVIPSALIEQMDAQQWQWVLAHELAHVRRRDYLVRWLEWLACVCFWWNPVVWWAQRNLRAMEEICCDVLVISSLKPQPRSYANSLLTAVEFLACPALRPPAMASEINSGGFLERRFRMIVSETPTRVNSRWPRACVLLCALAVLPFGMAYAQDYEAVGKRLGKAVEKGELTREQAGTMMAALKKAKASEADEDGPGIEERLKSIGDDLKAAVKAGKLTEEEAWEKWRHIKEKEIAPRLKAAVKAGKMTEEKGWAIWKGIEKAEIGEKLKAAVAKGEITEEQAKAKWAEVTKKFEGKEEVRDAAAIIGERIKSIGDDLKAAVKAGKITEEEAWKKWHHIKENEIAPRIKAAVEAGKMSAEKARDILKAIQKGEIGERLKAAVAKGEITEEQAKAKWAEVNKERDHDGGIKGHYNRMGVCDETLGQIKKHLKENGLSDEQIGAAFGGILRVIHELRSEGENFELDPKLRDYFKKEIDLTDKQIELVVGIARRIVHGLKQRGEGQMAEVGKKIRAAVQKGEITEEQGRAKMEAYRKSISATKAKKPSCPTKESDKK